LEKREEKKKRHLEGVTRFATHELERALQNGTRVAEGLFPLGVIDHHYVKYLPHLAHRTQPAKDYSFIHSQTQHAIRRRRKLTSTVSKQKQKQKCPLPDIHATRPHTERNLTATTTTMLQRRLLKKIEKRKKKKKPRARMFLSHCLKNGLLKGAAFRFGLVCLIHSLTSLFIFFHDTISLSLSLSRSLGIQN